MKYNIVPRAVRAPGAPARPAAAGQVRKSQERWRHEPKPGWQVAGVA